MRNAFRLLALLAFSGDILTSPLWILCNAPGPDGHQRVEFAWAACCGNHDEEAAPAPGTPCAADPGCCGACRDEQVAPPGLVQPARDARPHPVAAPSARVLPAPSAVAVAGTRRFPARTGDPPRFLAHCALRI